VRRDGRWFLSPVATSLRVLDAWVSNFDERRLYTLTNDYGDLQPDGALTFEQPTTVHSEAPLLAYAYTFQGAAGQQVIGTVQGHDEGMAIGTGAIIGPDGKALDDMCCLFDGYPVTLPVAGTYKLVVQPYDTDVTFTLWDAQSAPKDAFTGNGCLDYPDSSDVCIADGSASGIAIPGSDNATATSPPTPVTIAGSSATTAP
jgi:hypothetical protein